MADLTVADRTPRVQSAVGGVASAGPFAFPFEFVNLTDILVYLGSSTVPLTYGVDYTVTGTAVGVGFSSGSVTLTAAVSNTLVTTLRQTAIQRLTNFPSAGPFDTSQLNKELDGQVLMIQELRDRTTRSLVLSPTVVGVSGTLPSPVAGQALIWAGDGLSLVNGAVAGAAVSVAMQPVVNAATLALARTAFGFGTGLTGPLTKAPTITKLLSGSGTYTVPTGCTALRVRGKGGGGGGGGAGAAATSGGTAGSTTFGTFTAAGGSGGGGANGAGGVGGTVSAGAPDLPLTGQAGQTASQTTTALGGTGGGKGGGLGGTINTAGSNGSNYGGGGGGAGAQGGTAPGGGGGEGAEFHHLISAPAASYSYAVGGTGSAGGGAITGGVGSAGFIYIEEFYG
jgi:hypothetical protein